MAQKPKKIDPPKEDDNDDPDDGDETPMTRADVMKLVNGAVSGQLARKLGPAIEAGMAPVLAKLDSFKPADPADDEDDEVDPDDAPAPGKKGKIAPGKPDPATVKLAKKVDDLNRQLKERDDKLTAEANARKASRVESRLGEVLAELGVDKHRIRGAIAVHRAAASVDDASGNVLYKVKRDGYEEDLDPAEALKEWTATDEGKSYLAPTGSAGGSGARAPRPAGPGRKAAAGTAEAKAEKVAAAKTDLLGAVGQLVAGGSIAIE